MVSVNRDIRFRVLSKNSPKAQERPAHGDRSWPAVPADVSVGQTVPVTVLRGDRTDVQVTLGELGG